MEAFEKRLSKLGNIQLENKEGENKLIVTAPCELLRDVAEEIRHSGYDFLIDLIGMDYGDSYGVIYYLSKSYDPARVLVLKVATEDREKPRLYTVSDLWAIANYYEREAYDFFGIEFINHPDLRRMFLRQDWVGYPFRKDYDTSPEANPIPGDNEDIDDMERVPTLTLGGEGSVNKDYSNLFGEQEYVINFGPQHPSMHGVLQLRTALDGEIVKKIDPVFGYIHRGIEKMCEGYTYPQILHLTDRLDYLSGTMNRHAMCMLVEEALGLEIPDRAKIVRTIFDELTRIASHLLGWGCTCMDMGAITAFVYGMRDREKIMDVFEETAGGRLMVNYFVIGGLANDVHPNFKNRVKEFIPYMRKMLKEHHMLFTNNPISKGRMVGVGYLDKDVAIGLGATGPSSRASNWHNDIRKIEPYAAYDKADFDVVLREGCYTYDRYLIRLDEIEQSLRIIEQLVDMIDDGPGEFAVKTKPIIKLPEGDYFKRVENARGQFCVHVTSKGEKTPYRVKFRSPSMTLVTALAAMAPGDKVADLIMEGASLDYVIPCIDR